ncbi:MAG: hypothetical protein ACFWT0_05900 [Bifidobacterium crudilactis]
MSFAAAVAASRCLSADSDADADAEAAAEADRAGMSLLTAVPGLAATGADGVLEAPMVKEAIAKIIDRTAAGMLLLFFRMTIASNPASPRRNATRPVNTPNVAAGVKASAKDIAARTNAATTSFDQGTR